MTESKTCGECKYHKNNRCMLPCFTINHPAENAACHRFELKEPITNGDKIRQSGNQALAEIFDDIYNGNKCKYCIHHAGSGVCKLNPTPYSEYDEGYLDDEDCLSGFEAWLNATAESKEIEGEDE